MPAPYRNISVEVTADVAKYQAGLTQAGRATQRFGDQTKQGTAKASQSISAVGTQAQKTGGLWSRTTSGMSAGAVAMGTAVGLSVQQIGSKLIRMGIDAVESATQFEASMLNVQSLGEESTASIAHLSDAVLDMSTRLPQSAGVLAEGLYDIESSGFSGAAALQVLDASATAASAGLSDTATSARAITAVLNSYGQSGADASDVSDILFQTVNVGVVSFEELAQSIGNFVPMAAAMGINLKQATGALATMTLAGLPAAEAATSLQRVMQSFIKPSDQMSATMVRLGISLDDLKDPSFGLSGAMQRIAQDTDGSTVALQALFPDVRSLRGALALTANEGKTYDRVTRSYAKATEGAGATARAFREQMKGVNAQFQVFKNRLSAAAIGGLLKLFPTLKAGASDVGDFLADLGDRLAGAWQDAQDAIGDLVDIFGDLWAGAQPVATLLAGLFGGAVIGTVRGFAAALSIVTGLLAEHPGLIKAVGLAIAAWFVASKVMAVGGALSFILTTLQSIAATRGVSTTTAALEALGLKAGGASGFVSGLRGNLGKIAATGAIGVGIAAVTVLVKGLADGARKAKEEVKGINDAAAGKGLKGLRDAYNKNAKATQNFNGTINDSQSLLHQLGRGAQAFGQLITPFKNTVWDSTNALKEQGKSAAENKRRLGYMTDEVKILAERYGLTTGQVEKYLESDKDLNLTTATTKQVHDSLADSLADVAAKMGKTKAQAAGMTDVIASSGMSAEDFADGMSKAAQSASDAVTSFGDISKVADFKPPEVKVELPKISDIRGWYGRTLGATAQFSQDISRLIQQGYDPSLVTRFMQAGVEQAGPTVHTIAENYTAGLRDYINGAEGIMSEFANRQAELARLTYTATTSASDQAAKDLSAAASIVQASWDSKFTPESAAKKLGLSPADWNRIVNEFGIGVGKLETKAGGSKVKVPVEVDEKDIQKRLGTALQHLGSVVDGRKFRLTGAQILDLASIVGSVDNANAIINRLKEKRVAQVEANADPTTLAQTDAELDALKRVRDAMVHAHATGTAGAKGALDDVANPGGKPRTALIGAQVEWLAIQNARQRITDYIEGRTDRVPVGAAIHDHAKGGIDQYARGGISAFASGGITRRQMIKFGEPETGGEAFVPRLGITSVRAKKILDVAAGWHGMTVVPAGQLRGGSAAPVFQMGDMYVDARNSGSPAEVGQAVDKAMDRWVQRNPRKLVAAIGGHEAKLGRAR